MSECSRLSTRWPADAPDELRAGVVVVGSGFGGAVVAARLAAHLPPGEVIVLERGREIAPGGFPRTPTDVAAQVRTSANPLGMLDFRPSADLDILGGSALGGGSIFYAGVTIEPDAEVFDHGWPAGLDLSALRPYFDRVRAMLAVEKYADAGDAGTATPDPELAGSFAQHGAGRTDHLGRAAVHRAPLPKVVALRQMADHLGTGGFRKVPIAVNLTRVQGPNEHGVHQSKCTLCGNCVLGCNIGAKNSLVTNYLPAARKHGARLYSQVEVTALRRSTEPGMRWCVRGVARGLRDGRIVARRVRVDCRTVVLAGGTYGTVALLDAARRDGGLRLSPRLGENLSGNGDTYFLTLNGNDRLDAVGAADDARPDHEVGPTVVATIDLRGDPNVRALVQDGSLPVALTSALRTALALRLPWLDSRPHPATLREAVRRSQVWLAMGYDDAAGRLVPDRRGRLRVRWPDSERQALWRRLDSVFADIAERTGGTGRTKLRPGTPVTVHPLGGAPMADTVDRGVTDHLGRVFDPAELHHPGLYVADGSLCPTSLGANPSLTIAALAERIAEHLVRAHPTESEAA